MKNINPPVDDWYCQNCGREGREEDFIPSDGNPAPYVCPECGSTDVFFVHGDDEEGEND